MRGFLARFADYQIHQIGAKGMECRKLRHWQDQRVVVVGVNRELVTLAVPSLSLQ